MSLQERIAPTAGGVQPKSRTNWVVLVASPQVGLSVVVVALIAFNIATEPNFLVWANLTNVGRSLAVPLLIAGAGTLVLVTGGVDLSAGAVLGFGGILYAQLVVAGLMSWPALLVTIATGAAIGFFINGTLIGRLGMSFFVVTLGLGSLLRGSAFLWSDSASIDMSTDSLAQTLGNQAIIDGKIPIALLVSIGATVILWIVLRYTTFGRAVYAVGGNREAAELSGLRTAWVIAGVYGIVSLCAAAAGVMMVGRQTLADPNAGLGIELTVAAGIMLGGVALTGGVGSIWGAALGTLFLTLLTNTLALRGISNNWQLVVTGVILILAVYLDRVRQRLGAS